MNWTVLDTQIVVIGALAAVACGLIGAVLVVRRMAMLADAVSHSVLPGIVLAVVVLQGRHPLAMVIGAGLCGLFAAWLTSALTARSRVDPGAAIGLVYTGMFALGMLLVRLFADGIHVDADHVLFGSMELAALNRTSIAGIDVPVAAITLTIVVVVEGLLLFVLRRPIAFVGFDREQATLSGIRVSWLDVTLTAMAAVAAVTAFEAVGTILVLAVFVLPGATASLIAVRLRGLFSWSVVFAVGSVVLGHLGAITLPALLPKFVPGLQGQPIRDTSTAGMIALAGGVLFFATLALTRRRRPHYHRPTGDAALSSE